ncbi:MAG: phosphopyruvate hydratase [Halobacteriovoraceae bacterium]|nr:phosphopyruvate hydratase [Halobacteriovoraceae bacterium]
MGKIRKIWAREILDSRGNPTIEAEITTDKGFGAGKVPSGASTGSREACELRDGDPRFFLGKSVSKAVNNVNTVLADALKGKEVTDQKGLDERMIALDGSKNKENLGANAILAVSMAAAAAGASEMNLPLYRYLKEKLHFPNKEGKYILPMPLMNIINGGAHAANSLHIQEFMIAPHIKGGGFRDNLRAGVEIFHHLKKILNKKKYATNVGDEGGFAPDLSRHEEAMDIILAAVEEANYRPRRDISLSLDAAASEFHKNGKYIMHEKKYSTHEMINYYQKLADKYPLYSLEDGLDEKDFTGHEELTRRLGQSILLVGDDLFVTNKEILRKGIDKKQANAILIKVNQIGTLSETAQTMALAFDHDFKAIISHRSGETADTFIADLAVATGCGLIKAGSASRSDRVEKYNRLLPIEEELRHQAFYAGK